MIQLQELTMCILAGGLGTRLSDKFPGTPKCLVPVGGDPSIFHQLRLLKSQGINNVVMATGHFGELVEDSVGDGAKFGMEISYSSEGEEKLGTGGALARALPQLSDPFMFTYGDAYLRLDLSALLDGLDSATSEMLGVMSVLENADRWGQSNSEVQNNLVTRYSKTEPAGTFKHIDYGVTLLRKKPFESKAGELRFDAGDLISTLATDGLLGAFVVQDRFYEIGTSEARDETEAFLIESGVLG